MTFLPLLIAFDRLNLNLDFDLDKADAKTKLYFVAYRSILSHHLKQRHLERRNPATPGHRKKANNVDADLDHLAANLVHLRCLPYNKSIK